MVLNKNNFIAVIYICTVQLSTTDRQEGVLPTKVIFLGEISLNVKILNSGDSNVYFFFFLQILLIKSFLFFINPNALDVETIPCLMKLASPVRSNFEIYLVSDILFYDTLTSITWYT